MKVMKSNIPVHPYILYSAGHSSSTEMITRNFLFCFIVFSIYRNLGMYQLFKHLLEKWEKNTNNWRAVLFINHHIMPSPWGYGRLIKVKVAWQTVMITQRLLLEVMKDRSGKHMSWWRDMLTWNGTKSNQPILDSSDVFCVQGA